MVKYYVDTAIWRDYLENRSDNFRPLGEWALAFFNMVNDEGGELLASVIVLDELEEAASEEKIQEMFLDFHVRLVPLERKILVRARLISRKRQLPLGDAIHALLARREGALLISRDKDFLDLLDIVDFRKPEELL